MADCSNTSRKPPSYWDGEEHGLPEDFETLKEANEALDALARQNRAGQFDRMLIYDDEGLFKRKLEHR